MNDAATPNSLQKARIRKRLALSRIFGLAIILVPVFGASAWSGYPLLDAALFLAGFLLAVAGFCGRLWCLSYIAGQKKRVLVSQGPYSLCRHPLYFFSFVGGLGLGLCTRMLSIPVLFALAFAAYYPRAIRGEEAFLDQNFQGYEEYKKRVPPFFPRWSNFVEGDYMVSVSNFRREIVSTGAFLMVIGVFEVLASLHAAGVLPTWFLIP